MTGVVQRGNQRSGLTRYFGSSYSGSDRLLVYTTGATVGVGIQGGSVSLYWSWQDNNTGYDFHGICRHTRQRHQDITGPSRVTTVLGPRSKLLRYER